MTKFSISIASIFIQSVNSFSSALLLRSKIDCPESITHPFLFTFKGWITRTHSFSQYLMPVDGFGAYLTDT